MIWSEILTLLREIRDALRERPVTAPRGPCELLTLEEAALLLRCRRVNAEKILRRAGLVYAVGAREVVVEAELLAALREGRLSEDWRPPEPVPVAPREGVPLRRASLPR